MVVEAEEIILHPGYDADMFHRDDIALLKLSVAVPFNDAISRACWKYNDIEESAGQDYCYLAGWGAQEDADESTVLYKGKMTQVNRHACEKSWKRKLDPNVMCAGTKSQVLACQGDSGGALICVDNNGRHK